MNKEYERVREKIAQTLCQLNWKDWEKWWQRYQKYYRDKADQIFSIEGICIKADDQSLPISIKSSVYRQRKPSVDQRVMLKAGFVKVVKGEK